MEKTTKDIALSAMFIAMGVVLPFFTGQIPQIGKMLLPMHVPVFLCGLICGWKCGLGVGFVLPLLRSFVLGMPPLFPNAAAMAIELAVYGGIVGLLYGHSCRKSVAALYRSLLLAMLLGRAAWGIAEVVFLGIYGNVFTWQMFFAGAFLNALPGIIVQLILIPVVMLSLKRVGLVQG